MVTLVKMVTGMAMWAMVAGIVACGVCFLRHNLPDWLALTTLLLTCFVFGAIAGVVIGVAEEAKK